MTARELYDEIQLGDPNYVEPQVALELLRVLKVTATGVLELAGEVRLKTGSDPLMSSSRLILSEFIELPAETGEKHDARRN
jgi:hypothetical protein